MFKYHVNILCDAVNVEVLRFIVIYRIKFMHTSCNDVAFSLL